MSEYEWLEIFADNLADIMREGRWTQEDLAEDTGLTQATISRYLNKKQMPTLKAAINLCYVLGEDLNDLIDFGDKIY